MQKQKKFITPANISASRRQPQPLSTFIFNSVKNKRRKREIKCRSLRSKKKKLITAPASILKPTTRYERRGKIMLKRKNKNRIRKCAPPFIFGQVHNRVGKNNYKSFHLYFGFYQSNILTGRKNFSKNKTLELISAEDNNIHFWFSFLFPILSFAVTIIFRQALFFLFLLFISCGCGP